MEPGFKRFAGCAAAFIGAVLLLDGRGAALQLLLGVSTAAFLWLCCRTFDIPLVQVLCCVAIATAGEVLLSIGWGLYSYQHALIPLYVPPGHGLLYALAIVTARQHVFRQYERTIFCLVLIAGSALALITLAVFGDTWGLLWWAGSFALLWFARNRLMLSACFVYTLLLEWAGTANANWHWTPTVPYLGLTSANPPSGVGILYIVLDLLVVTIAAASVSPPGGRLDAESA
jgi:hypothetical protein